MKKFLNHIILFVGLIVSSVVSAQNSPLSEGDWYKISLSSTDVYKIDYNMLSSMGLNSKTPQSIKIYGYGGILPQQNSDFRYGDIVENNIYFHGGEDGTIDEGDYILFFGQGPDMIRESGNGLVHEKNPYDTKSYYYVTSSDSDGKRIQLSTEAITTTSSISSLPYLVYRENEETNVIKSGREWLGDPFRYKPSQTFGLSVTDIVNDSIVSYDIRYAGGSESYTTYMSTTINGTTMPDVTLKGIDSQYGSKASVKHLTDEILISSSSVSIKSEYDNLGDGGAVAFLDYIRLNYHRLLNGNRSVCFPLLEDYKNVKVDISNVSANTMVWDVSRVNEITQLPITNDAINIGGDITKLMMVNMSSTKTPSLVGRVDNQNLHAMEVPVLLIITHKSLSESALAMKAFKEEQGIETEVAYVSDIYNEYSSGSKDVSSMRDFCRDLYLKDDKFKYLMLFGDCSYDYKDRLDGNNNFVPIYQSRSSFNNTSSFSSDDYFGFFGEDEGYWIENDDGLETIDIGIGRLPVNNNDQGYRILEKIKNYIYLEENKGNWRNSVVFVADDEDNRTHMKHANNLSNVLLQNAEGINVTKVYLDAYEQVSSSGGQIAPIVNEELNKKVEKGSLIVNYSGHGSEEQWTQESILTMQQINNFSNKGRLPFFVTATCEFGRYDDPSLSSGAEQLLFNDNGGAIGLMTTTRPVYANSNYTINSSFYNNAFTRNADSTYDYIGEIQKKTKNGSIVSYYNRNFSLLGDPTMKLAYPDHKVVLTSVNDKSANEIDTLQALENVNIQGVINDVFDNLDLTFNGKIILTVYDKETIVSTLQDREKTETGSDEFIDEPYTFSERNSIVFEGEVAVINGVFEVEFIVPKDISYVYGEGKFSFYAVSDQGYDATGSFYNVVIGSGIDNFQDITVPEAFIYADDTTFVSGGITNRNPIFLANLFDENGVNTTNTGIGHEMTLIIDDDLSDIHVLNEYYSSIDNTYKKGLIEYPLYNLELGEHKLTFKAWDVNNNSVEKIIYINVADEGDIQAYPNPFSDQVTFYVDQPRSEVSGEVDIKIYNSLGENVWSQVYDFDSFTSVIDDIVWDGHGDGGKDLVSGIYFVISEIRYEDSFGNITEKTKLVLQK